MEVFSGFFWETWTPNHVFSATVAFNLLLGRCWPPRSEDLAQAEALCRALGLGTLLDRMPAGLLQIVGETGWQLSQGERSRFFIARTLPHSADCLILDESFAALDPETLHQAMPCVLEAPSDAAGHCSSLSYPRPTPEDQKRATLIFRTFYAKYEGIIIHQ